MTRRFAWIAGSLVLTVFLLPTSLFAQGSEYKKYERKGHREKLIEVGFYDKIIGIRIFVDGQELNTTTDQETIRHSEGSVTINDSVYFKTDGLHFGDYLVAYDRIADLLITEGDDYATITLYEYIGNPSRARRMHKGNLQTFDQPIEIQDDQFVRGMIFSVIGDIEVYGEVNKDVVSLFGNIYIGPGAVARGDLATATGEIDIASDASIYGEAYSANRDHDRQSYRFRRKKKKISFNGTFDYNRVDGVTPCIGVRFNDNDSLLPSVWAVGGYAFESARWRYDFGIEQTIFRKKSLVLGGSFYRELASQDDWLLDQGENMAFALLVTEDFKDYYESEGGKVYINYKPTTSINLSFDYNYEETRWIDAQPHLWSLFGGDKLFSENFGRVDEPLRSTGISELNGGINSTLHLSFDLDTRPEKPPVAYSAWHVNSAIEHSNPDFNSYYDFRRYTVTARRYQKIRDRSMLLLRAMYGGSDGYLPMYKRFYLGGLGTLRGYKHKEFTGNRFCMTNLEYRIAFPKSEFAVSLIWDMGQINNTTSFNSDDNVYHSLGGALHIGDDLRINISKRLDRSFDDSPKIYVRLEHKF